VTPDLEKQNKRNKFSKRLNFSIGGSTIDWLQSALKIRRCAKFFIKFWEFLIKDPPRAGSFRSNTRDSLGSTAGSGR
jgi:hypothetical protein